MFFKVLWKVLAYIYKRLPVIASLSSEDEKDAQEEYLWAKQQEKSNSVDLKETKTTQNTDNQTDKKIQKQNKKTKEVPYKFYSFKNFLRA